ncbi:MAG: sigma-70 family RNA polymerase sigma factor [Polyangiaceae bacterium]|nr:sigma-70 family RNA polymerase sigma factor [Polyangiaceae bacterium]
MTLVPLTTSRREAEPADPPEVMERFEKFLDLVHTIAKQVRAELGAGVEVQELVGYGMEGLLEASRRYDVDAGASFKKFAYFRVRGAMFDGLRAYGALSRRTHEKARALGTATLIAAGFFNDSSPSADGGLSLEDLDDRLAKQLAVLATAMAIGLNGHEATIKGERVIVVDDHADDVVERHQLMELVDRALPILDVHEADMVRRHFWRGESIDDISASRGYSKSWGSRILGRAIAKLANKILPQV